MKPNMIDLPVSSGLPVLTMWFICFLISVLALQMCTLNPVHINLGEVFIVVVVWGVLFGWLASETMFLCIVLTALELSRKTRQASKIRDLCVCFCFCLQSARINVMHQNDLL